MYSIKNLKSLEQEYGSPIYVFRENDFIDNYHKFKACFDKYYPKYVLAYSYKTNYTPYICKLVKDMGGYAEVVSDMEYSVAKAIGYEAKNIVYNGPFKGPLSEEALLEGGIINVDNLDELRRICIFAKDNANHAFKIGIRVNINIGQHFISRFGIDADSEDLDTAFEWVSKVDNMEIIGLHCHVGQSRTIEAWNNRVVRMLEIADKYFPNKPPKYIDLGSGMFANMNPSLASQFGDNIPTFEDYAKAVALPFAQHYMDYSFDEKPILMTEPGTTVINSYIDFIGKVEAIKEIKDKQFCVLNCSKDNLGDICKMKKLPLQIIHDNNEQTTLDKADFVGYTCLEHDVMYTEYSGPLSVGDYVVFENIGGYSNVSKPPFILWNCPMITIHQDSTSEIIKRGEKFEDVFATYKF